MDEPTTGLYTSDITHLLAIVDRLVDAGNTVIIIEHNLDVVRHAEARDVDHREVRARRLIASAAPRS